MIVTVEFTVTLLVLAILGGFAATAFLWYLWAQSDDSWLLRALARAATGTEVAGAYLGWIAYIRVTQGLSGVPVWTSALTTLAVVVMCATPIYLAISFLLNGRPK